jgi:hypothetical protein
MPVTPASTVLHSGEACTIRFKGKVVLMQFSDVGQYYADAKGPGRIKHAFKILRAVLGAAKAPNSIQIVFDMRGARGFSRKSVAPFSAEIKKIQPLITSGVDTTHVLVNSAIFRLALKLVLLVVRPTRPLKVNECPAALLADLE